ncbi:MAG: hypothetical protein ABIJ34_04460 [archaeon]
MNNNFEVIGIFLLLLLGVWILPFISTVGFGQTYNQTSLVNTTVNITNTAPTVFDVTISSSISLVAYSNFILECNATTYDYNNDTLEVNGTFHQSIVGSSGAADQNYRYYNTSCTPLTMQDYSMNWSCTFPLNYFTNNGTWYCNVTANDIRNASQSNISLLGTVNPLVAIKMDAVLDYGQLEANDISNDTVANITNAGNRDANISVMGYGAAEGDTYAMICSGGGTIPLSNERYSRTNGTAYASMTQLTGTSVNMTNFFVPQRLSEGADSVNSTFWRIQIPPSASGICNGKILFTASDRGN